MAFSEELAERIRHLTGSAQEHRGEEDVPMKGWVLVAPEGVEDNDQLSGWMQRAVQLVGKLPAKEKE